MRYTNTSWAIYVTESTSSRPCWSLGIHFLNSSVQTISQQHTLKLKQEIWTKIACKTQLWKSKHRTTHTAKILPSFHSKGMKTEERKMYGWTVTRFLCFLLTLPFRAKHHKIKASTTCYKGRMSGHGWFCSHLKISLKPNNPYHPSLGRLCTSLTDHII